MPSLSFIGLAPRASLGALSKGRDNNLNLLRFLAAALVIYAHSFGITGNIAREPFFAVFGIGIGDIAVDVFFVVSGFLIAKSFLAKPLHMFFWARVMRIYPALWVSNLMFVAVAGVCTSPLSALDFWTRTETFTYLLKNSVMLPGFGAQTTLPMAFDAVHKDFNTSLWTLPHELQMYLLLSGLGVIGILRFPALVVAVATFGAVAFLGNQFEWFHVLGPDRARLLFMFFSGVCFALLQSRIYMSGALALGCCVAVIATAVLTDDHRIHRVILAAVVPYMALWFGFVPRGAIRLFNRSGDYSYGLYILACPVQFYLTARHPDLQPLEVLLVTILVVLPLSVISWHWLESRAMLVPVPRTVLGWANHWARYRRS